MKKRNILLCTTAALTMAAMMTVGTYALGWAQSGNGRYGYFYMDENDGMKMYQDGWQWVDGNNDGIAECYYFDANGLTVVNGNTPDGYTVNSDGAWTVNGVVQTKNVGVDTTRIDYKVQQVVDSGNISWPVTVKTADHSFYEYLKNEKFIALVESQFVLDNGGYNEYGISNAAIDILTHSREENKKYGELFVVEEEPNYGNSMTITYKNGVTRSYIHSNKKYRDTSTSHVYCTYSWWPSLKNKETYLFKYASGTPDIYHRVEAYAAARQKLRDLGFDESKIDWSCLLTGQDISVEGQEGVLELAADLCTGAVFGATKNSTSQTSSSEVDLQYLLDLLLTPISN